MKAWTVSWDGHSFQLDAMEDCVAIMRTLNDFPGLVTVTCNHCGEQHQTGPDEYAFGVVRNARERAARDAAWEAQHEHAEVVQ